MNKAETTELRRVVRARFKLLRSQLGQAEEELRGAIQRRIEEEHATAIDSAEADTLALRERVTALQRDAAKLEKKYGRKGVVPADEPRRHRYSYQRDLVSIDVAPSWMPTDLQEKVDREFADLARERGAAEVQVEQRELELLEELAVGSLGSDEARAFLNRIPSVDTLLPTQQKVLAGAA